MVLNSRALTILFVKCFVKHASLSAKNLQTHTVRGTEVTEDTLENNIECGSGSDIYILEFVWWYQVFQRCCIKQVRQELNVFFFTFNSAMEQFCFSPLLMVCEEGNAFKMFLRPQGYRQGVLLATLNVTR